MKIRNKKTNEVKEVFSIESKKGKVYVKFTTHGKEYVYSEENVEVIDDTNEQRSMESFRIYKLIKRCYKCHKEIIIYTYIVFNDRTNEDLVFPWDKERLLENQDIIAHLKDPSIEYYGLKVIGDDEKLDNVIMDKFPNKIKVKYSCTQKKSYPMNICDYCGAGQGWYYIYYQVNEMIKNMKEILLEKG